MAEEPVIYTTEGAATGPLLVIHGGAGKRRHPYPEERDAQARAAIRRALDAGMAVLDAGGAAVDAVVAAVHVMEDDPTFNAGRGAALTSEGRVELDACLVRGDGATGAVTGVTTVRNPIDAARAVMDETRHVLFADPRKAQLDEWGVEQVENDYFVTQRRLDQLHELQSLPDGGYDRPGHGTIGVVARDASGVEHTVTAYATVIATGGFARDADMMAARCPDVADNDVEAGVGMGADGSGIRLALDAGAAWRDGGAWLSPADGKAVRATLGGLRVNADMQVLDEAGEPIPGLYAAGEDCVGSLAPTRLPAEGSCLSWALASGTIAGAAASLFAANELVASGNAS